MKNMNVVHLLWKEFEWNDDVYTKFNSKEDYGIYQIYGDHPVYGENSLLYIGKARYETYSARFKKHDDFNENHISKFSRLHLSYFCETEDTNYDNWGDYIDTVENILINAHFPAYNSQNIKKPIEIKKSEKEFIILNWEKRGKLLPEVSSLRYSYYYYDKKNLNLDKILKER